MLIPLVWVALAFLAEGAPAISTISPSTFPPSTSNQSIVVNGSGFVNGATLTFKDPSGATFQSNSTKLVFNSTIKITYQFNNDGDVGSWQVRVNNPDGQSSSYKTFQVSPASPAPSIDNISPSSYPASTSNQSLVVNGSGFVSGATLTFKDPSGDTFQSSSSKLVFNSTIKITYQFNNDGDAGNWQVRVNNPDGQSSSYKTFQVTPSAPAPSIANISPSSYPASTSNQSLVVNGSGFVNGATLTFKDPSGDTFQSSSSKLAFNSSIKITYQFNNDGDEGTWQVRVNNPDGQSSAYESFQVTPVAPAPSIDTVSPASFPASTSNQSLVVNGSGFVNGATLTFKDPSGASFESNSAKLSLNSSVQITYLFNNDGDDGTWQVRVNNPDGQNSPYQNFQVNPVPPAPSIDTISPSSYPASTSNQSLVVNGSGFVNGSTLTFKDPSGATIESNSAKLTLNSSIKITYLFNNDGDDGTWQVRVNNPDGQSSIYKNFVVTGATQSPSITSIQPSLISASNSNVALTIHGTGFQPGATLLFDPPCGPNIESRSSKLNFKSPTRIEYLFNSLNDAGAWTVLVKNPDGGTSTALAFNVSVTEMLPEATAIEPTSLMASYGHQTITIRGNNFDPNATLLFDPPSGSDIPSSTARLNYVSPQMIRYSINTFADAGMWTVRVVNPGNNMSLPLTLFVEDATTQPTISAVSPQSVVPSNSPVMLAIRGAGFVEGTSLVFRSPSGVDFPSKPERLTILSPGEIQCSFNNGGERGTWNVFVTNASGVLSGPVPVVADYAPNTPYLFRVAPGAIGSTDLATLKFTGAGFTSNTSLRLLGPGGLERAFPANSLARVGMEQISATLTEPLTPGNWKARAENSGGGVSSDLAIMVKDQATGGMCMPSVEEFQTAIAVGYSTLSAEQLDSINLLYDSFLEEGDGDVRKLAYIFATVRAECDFLCVPERRAAQGNDTWLLQENYWYTGFYGRGYVQLTGEDNYTRMSGVLKMDLVGNKDLALVPETAAFITVYGMMTGFFTGAPLARFINDEDELFYKARIVVNGLDRAQTIANWAKSILMNLPASANCTPVAGPSPVRAVQLAADHIVVESFTEERKKFIVQVSDDLLEWTTVGEVDHEDSPWLTTPAYDFDPSQHPKGFVRMVPSNE